MAEKKSTYVDQMKDLVGRDIDWGKLTLADLAILTKFFSSPKLVVMTFMEDLDDDGRAEVARFLEPAPAGAPEASRTAGGHDLLEGRPVLQKVRNTIFGGPILEQLQGGGD